jgi:hypothetical protein
VEKGKPWNVLEIGLQPLRSPDISQLLSRVLKKKALQLLKFILIYSYDRHSVSNSHNVAKLTELYLGTLWLTNPHKKEIQGCKIRGTR